MEPNKILQADLLDIVFEGKNKDYGAYELRKRYNKRISMALIITFAALLIIVGATVLAKQLGGATDDQVAVRDVVIQNVQEEQKPPPPPPPPPKTPPPPKVETAKFTPPIIKKDEEVKKEEIPPVNELKDTKIDIQSQEGIKDEGIAAPPVVDEGKQVVEQQKEDPNEVFTRVEIEAKVDLKQWRRYLENQLQRYIDDAGSQGMAPGQYTVNVRFLVEKDGSVTDVQSLNDPGFGLGKGAVDVVKKGPKWDPGIQNGRPVRSYHTQPITFVISEQ